MGDVKLGHVFQAELQQLRQLPGPGHHQQAVSRRDRRRGGTLQAPVEHTVPTGGAQEFASANDILDNAELRIRIS